MNCCRVCGAEIDSEAPVCNDCLANGNGGLPVPHPHQTPHQRRHGDLLSPGSPDQHVVFMGG